MENLKNKIKNEVEQIHNMNVLRIIDDFITNIVKK